MPDFGGAISGAAGGAGVGLAFGELGAPIGAGIGFISGLFQDSPEERRRKAINEAKANLDVMRAKTLERGRREINSSIQRNMAFSAAGASRRAAVNGSPNAEGYIVPAQTNVAREGSKALSSFETNTNNAYDQSLANLEIGNATAPLTPSFGDYLLPVGEAAARYKMNQDYISILKGAAPPTTTGPTTVTKAPDFNKDFTPPDNVTKFGQSSYDQRYPYGNGINTVGSNSFGTFSPSVLETPAMPRPRGFGD